MHAHKVTPLLVAHRMCDKETNCIFYNRLSEKVFAYQNLLGLKLLGKERTSVVEDSTMGDSWRPEHNYPGSAPD